MNCVSSVNIASAIIKLHLNNFYDFLMFTGPLNCLRCGQNWNKTILQKIERLSSMRDIARLNCK